MASNSFASKGSDGRWKASCVAVDGTLYMTSVIELRGATWTDWISYYSDALCTVPYVNEVVVSQFTTTPSGDHYDLDEVFQQFLLAPSGEKAVSGYNTKSVCGFSDWELGIYKVVTGNTLNGCRYLAKGTPFYSIVSFSEDGKMRTGKFDKDHDGKTPATRSIEFMDIVWQREP